MGVSGVLLGDCAMVLGIKVVTNVVETTIMENVEGDTVLYKIRHKFMEREAEINYDKTKDIVSYAEVKRMEQGERVHGGSLKGKAAVGNACWERQEILGEGRKSMGKQKGFVYL